MLVMDFTVLIIWRTVGSAFSGQRDFAHIAMFRRVFAGIGE